MQTKRPSLICIGATKAGTSWLFQNLSANPAVWSAPIKEVNAVPERYSPDTLHWAGRYLSRQLERMDTHGGASALGWDRGVHDQYVAGLRARNRQDASWYDTFFGPALAEQNAVDISPGYGTLPKDGIGFLCDSCPDAQFVYIVREPIDRARSHLRMQAPRPGRMPRDAEGWSRLAREVSVLRDSEYATNVAGVCGRQAYVFALWLDQIRPFGVS